MSIGLYDADMSVYTHVPFNLELMKLAAYYARKREIVALSPVFNPTSYTRFIYRKDYYDGGFDSRLRQFDNIEYGGYAFSSNNYTPLPLDIEKQIPNAAIYSKYKDKFSTLKKYENFFGGMSNNAHFRLSLDGKEVWGDYEKQIQMNEQNRLLFLHDYNVAAIKDADLAIKDTLNHLKETKYTRAIAMKFPLVVQDEAELFKWLAFIPAQSAYTIRYDGVMSDEALVDFARLRPTSGIMNQFEYMVASPRYEENHFLEVLLPRIFNQVIFLQMCRQKITLVYDDYFFTNPKWEQVIKFLNSYLSWSQNIFDDTTVSLAYFASHLQETSTRKLPFLRQDARDIFQFVGEQNYELFKKFYECSRVQLIGGILQ